jgi:hypothetical protein
MSSRISLKELPGQDDPGYFRLLVRNCIETYKELPNDAVCLDYNRVTGKLRALVLDDEEYKQETRNIYAEQQLEELRKIDGLERIALSDDEDENDPRSKGRRGKTSGVDKDLLNIRKNIAQMRREILASMDENSNVSERDAMNLMFVGMTREEVEKSVRNELFDGDVGDALGELANGKEEAPEGTSGKVRINGRDGPLDDGDFFETLPGGEIVEK